jgi:hypothetical protein
MRSHRARPASTSHAGQLWSSSGLRPAGVVGGVGDNRDVVRVASPEPCGGDLDELGVLQGGDGGGAGEAHAGAQAAGELVDDLVQGAAVAGASLDALGDELAFGEASSWKYRSRE